MLSEFYNYIASKTISYFQGLDINHHVGERFCLMLDNEEMVKGVDSALFDLAKTLQIIGNYSYGDVYQTFTIRLSDNLDVIVASKKDGMKDDFLATLRNVDLVNEKKILLMIIHSTIDTISSGTGDLSSSGMPFNAKELIKGIEDAIGDSQFSVADTTFLKYELRQKQQDRFSDKSSLFEYCDLLSILGRGIITAQDFPKFSVLPDPEGWAHYAENPSKIEERLKENQKYFEIIDFAFKHGSIDDLGKHFEQRFLKKLNTSKKRGEVWYDELTFHDIKLAHDRLKKQYNNPLQIDEKEFEVYSESPVQMRYCLDEDYFVRNAGNTKAASRKKSILIFKTNDYNEVIISIPVNKYIPKNAISSNGLSVTSSASEIKLSLPAKGCSFAKVSISDIENKIKYELKTCVLNLPVAFLGNIRTCFQLDIKKNLEKSQIRILGIDDALYVNENTGTVVEKNIVPGEVYSCNYNESLVLKLIPESIESDTGKIDITIKTGAIEIPLLLIDDVSKPEEITGAGLFKCKHKEKKSLTYRQRDQKLIIGTQEYFTKGELKEALLLENKLVREGWLAVKRTLDTDEEYALNVSDDVKEAYFSLLKAYRDEQTLPSLAYYSNELLNAASNYVNVIYQKMVEVPEASTVDIKNGDMLFLGCVFDRNDVILMSPLHPLNIMYQLLLIKEKGVDSIRDDLVDKLSPLYLLPYIKDKHNRLYRAAEIRRTPEWRKYVPFLSKRYQGGKNYVEKLVREKILEYKEHFSFLFSNIDNKEFRINLVNMGDCREILHGLISFYIKEKGEDKNPDELTKFIIHIYNSGNEYNEFYMLGDEKNLDTYLLNNVAKNVDISEMKQILAGNIKCYFHNENESQYQYAHLTFYEMENEESKGSNQMDRFTTGIALNGLTSGVPSLLDVNWYKTAFGTKYAVDNTLINMSRLYNALFRVAFEGSSYDSKQGIFTSIRAGQEGRLAKIYDSSNWVIFVDPKVDLSFFAKKTDADDNVMIIHYSDQYTSASGFDDITVTKKSEQYNNIIRSELLKKGVQTNQKSIGDIINLFNAINGSWLLKLVTSKKLVGAADSNFSREKMSILSAIKLCIAYFAHPNIIWVPLSLEEMLRVSRGVGLSPKEGILSAKNLGFETGATSDDILFVGIERKDDGLHVYLHPIEVKIGINASNVINKACLQVANTYNSFINALWPDDDSRDDIERKLSRNFLMQLVIAEVEKIRLYGIYPEQKWERIVDEYREELLNEKYIISKELEKYITKGTVISFKTDAVLSTKEITEDYTVLELPEHYGAQYMVLSPDQILKELYSNADLYPSELQKKYKNDSLLHVLNQEKQVELKGYQIGSVQDVNLVAEPPIQYNVSKDTEIEEVSKETIVDQLETDKNDLYESNENIEQVGMKVLFGTDVSNGNDLYWYPNDTNQLFHTNTGIIGTMGTGKTQFTKSMVTQLYQQQEFNVSGQSIGILIFDYKGDYNESKEDFVNATNATVLQPYHLPYNPLALTKGRVFKPLLPIHTANSFKDTLSKVYNLGHKQQNALFNCIKQAYNANGIMEGDPNTWDKTPPTFNMVYQIYDADEDIKKGDSLSSAMDKLYQFQIFEGDPDKTVSLYDLLNGVVVIDLSAYDSDIQSLIVAITLDLFYSQMQAAGSSQIENEYRQMTKFILVDEADNFMQEGFPSLKKIMKEGREFGVGTILSTQFLKHFGTGDDDYSKYILTWVVHNVADLKSSDVDFVFKTEPKSIENQKLFNDIKSLKKHHSITKIGNAEPCYIEDWPFWKMVKK